MPFFPPKRMAMHATDLIILTQISVLQAMFCSKLEMAPGWDKQALRPVLDSLSDKQDVPKVCHVVTVGSAAGQSRTLEQLCNLRLAKLQSLYRDHAAELSSLLPQVSPGREFASIQIQCAALRTADRRRSIS